MALLQYSAYVDKEIARLGAENDSQGLLREYRLALLEREQLYEDAKIADAAFFLEAAAQAYEANLKSVVLPLLHAESSKAAEEKGEDPKSAKVEHRTVYGSAYLRCAAVYKLNWDKLAEIDPALVSEVKPEPTFTKTSLEQAISRLKLEETHSAKAIWEELKEETGKRSEATLKIKLKEPVKERSVKPFLKQIAIPENWGIDEHLQAIIEARVNKLKLLREAGVANQLGMIEMKISGIQELMLQKLKEEGLKEAQEKQQLLPGQEAKAPSSWKSSGEIGEVSYSSRALDTRDVNKLIEKYPDIAELAVDRNRQPSKTAVQEALRSRGYEPAQVESMAESLFEVVGYGKAETWIYPKYGLYYKGPDEEFLDDSGQLK